MDKSLLRQISPERYDIHEVLRHYAQEKLAEVPKEEGQALIRYRDYYTTFLHERAEALEQRTDPTENSADFYTDIDNLWAGWVRIMEQHKAQDFASALVRALQEAHFAQFSWSVDTLLMVEHQQQLLERRSSVVDVCLIDMIWTDTLAEQLLDLSEALEAEAQDHFSIYVEYCQFTGYNAPVDNSKGTPANNGKNAPVNNSKNRPGIRK
jgi:hypothetical protein